MNPALRVAALQMCAGTVPGPNLAARDDDTQGIVVAELDLDAVAEARGRVAFACQCAPVFAKPQWRRRRLSAAEGKIS